MPKTGYVYILTNKRNTVLYIGVTSNLRGRIWQHKKKIVAGFTKKYNLQKLVYFEIYDNMASAIAREKQLKGGSRQRKIDLIQEENPTWKDLYSDIV